MSPLPLVGPEDLDAEQKAFWEYIVTRPAGRELARASQISAGAI
jgi:hypothetical protein